MNVRCPNQFWHHIDTSFAQILISKILVRFCSCYSTSSSCKYIVEKVSCYLCEKFQSETLKNFFELQSTKKWYANITWVEKHLKANLLVLIPKLKTNISWWKNFLPDGTNLLGKVEVGQTSFVLSSKNRRRWSFSSFFNFSLLDFQYQKLF